MRKPRAGRAQTRTVTANHRLRCSDWVQKEREQQDKSERCYQLQCNTDPGPHSEIQSVQGIRKAWVSIREDAI